MLTGTPEPPQLIRRRWSRFLEESSFIREGFWKYRGLAIAGLLSLVLVDILEVVPPILLKDAVDAAMGAKPARLLIWLGVAYVAVSFFQALGRYGWRMYLIRSSMLAGRDLRQRFADHLFGLGASFFDRRPIGDLMGLATSDTEAVRQMLGPGLLTLADSIFYFLTVPVAMFLLSPKLTLLAFVPLPVIPWLVMRNDREVHKRYKKVQEGFSTLSAMTQEGLNGVRVLKAFAKEDAKAARFRAAGERFVRDSLQLARVQTSFGPTLDFTMSLGMVLLLFVGGRLMIQGNGTGAAITLGTFVAFQRYIQKMVWPMAALGMALGNYQRSITSSARLKDIFRSRTDVPEAERPLLPEGAGASGWKTAGRVELHGLRFRFPGTEKDVLRGLTLTIESGERVAFVGSVGSGKSALLSLLPRLYPVARGMLLIDGIDINDWPIAELRRQVGYVSQDVFLFSETVTENIAYGLAQTLADIEPNSTSFVEEATRLACVHEDVLGLTGSYETRLGERGVNLSGGQKQRLTIARAIVKKPPVLVLDDALSSVDVQTEERILRGLRQRPGRHTEIIAAHRISTIQDANRIAVIEGGEIRQLGTHAELIRDRRGSYFRFYEQQRLKEDLEQYVEALEGPEATA